MGLIQLLYWLSMIIYVPHFSSILDLLPYKYSNCTEYSASWIDGRSPFNLSPWLEDRPALYQLQDSSFHPNFSTSQSPTCYHDLAYGPMASAMYSDSMSHPDEPSQPRQNPAPAL
jgi:hypothetical protein